MAIIDALTRSDVITFADKRYQGGRSVHTPFERTATGRDCSADRRSSTARARPDLCPRGTSHRDAQRLEILIKLCCCAHRATAIVYVILVRHLVETSHYTG
jgi:hypothetical protein